MEGEQNGMEGKQNGIEGKQNGTEGKQNGIEDKLLALFQNYLGNRKQRTVINGPQSSWSYIVLGPLTFLGLC